MAQATTVGSLLVSLGMDSTQFQREATKAQSKTAAIAQSFNMTGKQVYEASQRMGVSVAGFASSMQSLQARVNPAAAALDRYRREATLLKEAFRNNIITQEQFNTSLRQSIQVYRDASRGVQVANDNIEASAGGVRAGMQQLNYQIGDMVTMWSMGAKPMQIFASQAGQTTQAIQLMTNGAGKFGAFMTGPWGMAITSGVVILGTLLSRLGDTEEKLKDVGKAARDAMDELRASLSGVSAMSDAIDKSAKARVEAMGKEAKALRALEAARSEAAATPGYGGTAGGGAVGVSAASRIARAEADLKAARAARKAAEDDLAEIPALGRAAAMQARNREIADKSPDKPNKGRKGRTPDTQTAAEQFDALSNYDAEILRARIALATSAESRAELEGQLLDLEKSQRFAEIEANKSLSQAQRDEQKAKLERLYGPQTPDAGDITVGQGLAYQIQLRDQEAERLRMAQESRSRQIEMLDAMAAITPSVRARADIEAKALELQQQTERDLLEQQIANGQIADADKDRAALASKQAAQREALTQRNMTPLERYSYDLKASAANLNEAMESIQVDAMESLNDQLAQAIVNFDNLGKVAQNVFKQMLADLIRLQLQKNLSSGISSVLGGIGKLFGAGLGAPIDVSGMANNTLSPMGFNIAGARANGGPVRAGLPYLVGERGPEIVVPGASGQVIPNHELGAMRGMAVQVIPSPYFDVVVQQQAAGVAAPMASAAAVQGSSGAQVALARKQSRIIP